MSNATVFKVPGQDPVVIVGELKAQQISLFLAAGWTMGKAMFNKHGIPLAPATHKLKRAKEITLAPN